MKNTLKSVYPHEIDPLIFFQDCDINHQPVLGDYYQLITGNHFQQAAELLNKSDIDFYGAWLYNLIEDRLRTTEEHIGDFGDKKPVLVAYNTDVSTNEVLHWTGLSGGIELFAKKLSIDIPIGSTSVVFNDEYLKENSLVLNYFSGVSLTITSIDGDASEHSYTVNFKETEEEATIVIIIVMQQQRDPFANPRSILTDFSGVIGNTKFYFMIRDLDSGGTSVKFTSEDIAEDTLLLPVFAMRNLRKYETNYQVVNNNLSYYFYTSSPNKVALAFVNEWSNGSDETFFNTQLDSYILRKTLKAGERELRFEDDRLSEESCVALYSFVEGVSINSTEYENKAIICDVEPMDNDVTFALFVIQ